MSWEGFDKATPVALCLVGLQGSPEQIALSSPSAGLGKRLQQAMSSNSRPWPPGQPLPGISMSQLAR